MLFKSQFQQLAGGVQHSFPDFGVHRGFITAHMPLSQLNVAVLGKLFYAKPPQSSFGPFFRILYRLLPFTLCRLAFVARRDIQSILNRESQGFSQDGQRPPSRAHPQNRQAGLQIKFLRLRFDVVSYYNFDAD